jgi:hypothetical protein
LEGRLSRWLVIAGYLDTTVLIGIGILFHNGEPGDPRNLALVEANTALTDGFKSTARFIGDRALPRGARDPRAPLAPRDPALATRVRTRLLDRRRGRCRLGGQHP